MKELLGSLYWRLRGGQLSPARSAWSLALGLFIGCSPLYGLHWALCLAVCLPLRLDVIVCYLAANISNPLFAPALFGFEVELGSRVLTGHSALFDAERDVETSLQGFFTQALVGGALLGATLGLLAGLSLFVLMQRFWVRTKTPLLLALERTLSRYRTASRAHRSYVKNKLSLDPLYRFLFELNQEQRLLPDTLGRVLDVGCGRGQLGLFLLDLGWAESLRGCDWDEQKIVIASDAAGGDAEFFVAHASDADFSKTDTILIIDLLHYLTRAEQDALLERAARSLSERGRLVLRDVDAALSLRSFLTISFERIGTALGVNRGQRLCFRPAREYVQVLERAGLECDVVAAPLPLANVVIVGKKSPIVKTPPQ